VFEWEGLSNLSSSRLVCYLLEFHTDYIMTCNRYYRWIEVGNISNEEDHAPSLRSVMVPVTTATSPAVVVMVDSQPEEMNLASAPPDDVPHGADASEENAEGNTPSLDPPKYTYSVPPNYNVATELPSYDEVQRMKIEEEERRQLDPNRECLNVDPFSSEDGLLGTDLTFLSAFFVSFMFNWIGFLLLMCFCHTIAGRYGALAGFGLSLSKWTLIVKHSTDLITQENSWLGWLVLAFGMLICVRSILQYVHIKREWRLLTRAAQERLLYFY